MARNGGVKPIRGSEESLIAATGASYAQWFKQLDDAGAIEADGTPWPHGRIAGWLVGQGVDGWWAQHLTVVYEQEHGIRAPGQRANGTFSATASRMLDLPVRDAVRRVVPVVAEAFGAELPNVNLETKHPSGRIRPGDGTVIVIGFSPRAQGRSAVSLEHAGLSADADLDGAKARLREVLAGID